MGLLSELDYRTPPPNGAQRAFWHVASSPAGAWTLARLAPPLDRLILERTGGQRSLAGLVAGIPLITLVTTGARSGQRRHSPLLGIPFRGELAVIGTAFGQGSTPAWWHNLVAHPDVEVAYRGRSVQARARAATAEEADEIWRAGRSIYAGYEVYARRIKDRPIHIAVLEALGR